MKGNWPTKMVDSTKHGSNKGTEKLKIFYEKQHKSLVNILLQNIQIK